MPISSIPGLVLKAEMRPTAWDFSAGEGKFSQAYFVYGKKI